MISPRRHLPNSTWILGGIVILAALVMALLYSRSSAPAEPTGRWVKDDRGVWVAEGTPIDTPTDVRQQQFLIREAKLAYDVVRDTAQDLSSGPCLGPIFQDWVADIVHVPRGSVDDEPANQCDAYRSGVARHFIELSLTGDVVRVE